MCPDCERLKENPSLTGWHLVHPGDRTRHVVDAKGFAVCPVCDAVWKKSSTSQPWWLETAPEKKSKAKRATKNR